MRSYELHDEPALDAPVLVVGLEGWIDSGNVGATAVQTLLEELDNEPVATFDANALLDHRARRPIVHLVDGVNTGLTWPSIELHAARDEAGHDLLILHGAEPDHSWRSFVEDVVELIQDFGVRMTVGLGAYPAAVPHTRSVPLSVTATTEELAGMSGLLRGSLDVPGGAQAAIEHRCGELDLPALTLWAQVPHYISVDGSPYPAGAVALLDQLERTTGLVLPRGELPEEAERTRNRIDAAIAGNVEHTTMLHALEEQHDTNLPNGGHPSRGDAPLPTADELAEEVERFLKDQED